MARTFMLLLFYAVLIYLAIEDFKERKISNWCHMFILMASIVTIPVFSEISLIMRGLGMLAVSVPMTVLSMLFPGSFGGGDIKLVFACGAFLGLRMVLKGTVLAILFAGFYSLWLIATQKEVKNMQFALGPYLSAGFIISSFMLF